MCHILSLLVAYLFLVIVQSAGSGLSDGSCTAFGFVIYFALLCSFFWLNIMCIDIYITFSSFTPPRVHRSEKKKFLSYIVYSWGTPFVIILVTAIMEFYPGISDDYIKPEFKKTCWFEKYSSRLAYFIATVGVLVLCNVVLFILTAFNIHKVNRETSILHRGNSTKNNEDKNRMKLYIKLSIVMGVSWILEIVSYLIGGSKCIWLFTDTVNTLQGVFIFLIFVWKKNVKDLMKKRLRNFINRFKKPSPEIYETKEDDDTERSTSKSGETASTNLLSLELQNKNASP
ncbi:G-protein coupled receptor Mth2-like [Hetaerina americana]|uniref:G-protein coupled receptor Mth2-like n=1 Tax=Hetaerina americana TaxID=62018 RepID=UPI003A7F244E